MKYLSVCSGIEAASVAWHPLGWKPVGFSEIEPFPCAILKHRFPNIPNYGSLTEYPSWPIEPGSIDLLVGGTPCQSFSVAGLRKGLTDPRGNLALTFLGLAEKLKPKWIIWENVPGALSSNGGRDFGSFLGALVQLGYGFAYRVLDAQHFGVAQRRRRIFVVACLGDWQSAAEGLSFKEGLFGGNKDGRKKRNSTSTKSFICPQKESITAQLGTPNCTISGTLRANRGSGWRSNGTPVEPVVIYDNKVRRLTACEYERLQGFPDNWSMIPWKGRLEQDCPDALRMKAVGNSMAVPVMRFIGEAIARYEAAKEGKPGA